MLILLPIVFFAYVSCQNKELENFNSSSIATLQNGIPFSSCVQYGEEVYFKIDVDVESDYLTIDVQLLPNLIDSKGFPVNVDIEVSLDPPPFTHTLDFDTNRYFRFLTLKVEDRHVSGVYYIGIKGIYGDSNFLISASSQGCIDTIENGTQISSRGDGKPCLAYDGPENIQGIIVSVTPVVRQTVLEFTDVEGLLKPHSTRVNPNILYLPKDMLLFNTGETTVPRDWEVVVSNYDTSKYTPEYEVSVQSFQEHGVLITGIAKYSAVGSENNMTYFMFPKEYIFEDDLYSLLLSGIRDESMTYYPCLDIFVSQTDPKPSYWSYRWNGHTRKKWDEVSIKLTGIDPELDLFISVTLCNVPQNPYGRFMVEVMAKSQPLLLIVESQRVLNYDYVSKIMWHTTDEKMSFFQLQLDSCDNQYATDTEIYMEALGGSREKIDAHSINSGYSLVYNPEKKPLDILTNYLLDIDSDNLKSYLLWISTNSYNEKPAATGPIVALFGDDCKGVYCNVTISVENIDWSHIQDYIYLYFVKQVPRIQNSMDLDEQKETLEKYNVHTMCALFVFAFGRGKGKFLEDYGKMDYFYEDNNYYARKTVLLDRRYDYIFNSVVQDTSNMLATVLNPIFVPMAREKASENENKDDRIDIKFHIPYDPETVKLIGLLTSVGIGTIGLCFAFVCCVILVCGTSLCGSTFLFTGGLAWSAVLCFQAGDIVDVLNGKRVMLVTIDGDEVMDDDEEEEDERSSLLKNELGQYGDL